MDLTNLNGAFDILKVDVENDSYTTEDTLFLTRNLSRGSFDISYSVDAEDRSEIQGVVFSTVGQETYATVSYAGEEKTYVVVDNNHLYITLVNVDDVEDVLKLVYNKAYNEFDYEEFYASVANLKDDELKDELHTVVDNQKVLSYKNARKAFFGTIDNFDGVVECVYTGRTVNTHGIPNSNVMNCEHTWPQSKFGGGNTGAKKTDINHLYPSNSRANSIRGNYPFGNVKNAKWSEGGSSKGTGEFGGTVFEPRDEHKGNVARSMFYFAVRYNMHIDSNQERTLREWNKLDPVDEKELARNSGIEMEQYNRNTFIDHPEFADMISDF
ncbi:MAG: hypothetical protein C0601_07400 [Candidatus Muiribacterium halophilum]|uniref:Endonuclease I n=1 Tax=Muiribacterium halophilum TaxID=2053465 RepID=A0A2N5ZFV1_MUIH1|nr:MAG: hypothetical protein C0601_07400 [Candidatus Muirbacterium halophilum]